jgi:hypothetical protein
MVDLDLVGPSRAISAKDLVGAEYPISKKTKTRKTSSGRKKVVGSELKARRDQWMLCDSN